MDDASLTYILDIIKTDDEATADANSLYEAIGPFLVCYLTIFQCSSTWQESSANNGVAVDGLAECRKVLKVWPSKTSASRPSTSLKLSAPVIIATQDTLKTAPPAALVIRLCNCVPCSKADGDSGSDCLKKQAEIKAEAEVRSSSPPDTDEMAKGEATHLSDVRINYMWVFND